MIQTIPTETTTFISSARRGGKQIPITVDLCNMSAKGGDDVYTAFIELKAALNKILRDENDYFHQLLSFRGDDDVDLESLMLASLERQASFFYLNNQLEQVKY